MEDKNEKSPFLQPNDKPVTLISRESPRLAGGKADVKEPLTAEQILKPPTDKLKLVFLIFLIHGLGTLMPWNMFINAKHYFVDFKLAPTGNVTSVYATNFMPYIGFAAQIPNFIFNWLNIYVRLGGDLTKRIVYSIIVELFIFLFTVTLAIMDSSTWQDAFFWITMISVVVLNMASGVYQNTIYGMVATLPSKYTGAVVLGANISGCFTSIVDISSTYIFATVRTAAIYYFITAMLVLLICFDTYFALPLNKFYRYNNLMRKNAEKSDVQDKKENTHPDTVPFWAIFKQASPQLINVFLIFFVTLSLFPALHSDIKVVDSDFVVSSKLFTSVTCFLTFNVCAMLGSLTTSWIHFPSPRYLFVPVLLRFLFLPLFLFCNYHPKNMVRTLPVFIKNDWVYWTLAVLMSYSSGYLSSLGMMYAPQTVQPKHQTTAGMFAAAMLISGIFSGILFSFLWPSIVTI